MPAKQYYKHGDWKVACDVCGFLYFGSELRKRWDGYWVCQKDWEPRPPQEFVRGIKENVNPPYSRPEVASTALTGYVQALAGATSITSANLGSDGRVIVDVLPQLMDVYSQGAVTITIAASIVTGNVVVINGIKNAGVAVTIINNSTGTVIQND